MYIVLRRATPNLMPTTENLQRQHQTLQTMAAEMIRLVGRPRPEVAEVRRALARFSGTLRLHATMEEDALYPRMFASDDPEVRHAAERLHADLGGLYRMWDDFMDRWDTAEAIENSLLRFRFNLGRVLFKLGIRMRREDNELYPLARRGSSWPPDGEGDSTHRM